MSKDNHERQSVATIKKNLRRLEAVIKSPYVRQADIATRDRLALRFQDAIAAQ